MADDQGISIVSYEDRFADDFARLNREWLDRFGLYEETDGKQLYAPRQAIIDTGGEIFVAMKAGRVVGTCALVRMSLWMFEIAKLSVDKDVRGAGLGRRLTQYAIDRARQLHATTVALVSSTKLTNALRLYESMGFVHKPLPASQPYATADVYMELELSEDDDSGVKRI